MIPVDLALYDRTNGTRIPYPVYRGEATLGTGQHGDESAALFAPMTRYQALALYERLSAELEIRATAAGCAIWTGRAEDIQITDAGVAITALGRWRALRDAPYTALWSDTQLGRWRELTSSDRASRTPERFSFDTNNRLLIMPKTGQSYDTTRIGSFVYEPPSMASRTIAGLMCAVTHLLPNATWTLRIGTISGTIGGGAFTSQATVTGTGALVTTTFYLNFAAQDYLVFDLFYNGGLTPYAGTDGDFYVSITDIRVVSATSPSIGGNLGTAVGAPGSVVVTPTAGTTGIYVGQKIRVSGTVSEIVTVTAVTSTTFTATFAQTHLATDPIRAFLIYADAIARDMRDEANMLNPGALSTSNALIQSPGLDLLDQVYEDADMGDALTTLAALGDTSGQRYEVGVDGSALYLRPQGSAAQAWYVDASSVDVQQTLDQLYNSVYATYQREDSFTLRTAAQGDAASAAQYGGVRRRAVQAQTSSGTVAARIAQTSRDDTKDPVPRAAIAFRRVYTASGAAAPLWLPRAGDTITVRNLSPVSGAAVNRVRTFRIFEATYDAVGNTLSVVPETPLPLLEYLLARQAAFGDVAAGPLGLP